MGWQYQLTLIVYTHHLFVSLLRVFFLGKCSDVCSKRHTGMFVAGLFIIGEIENILTFCTEEDLNKHSTLK